MPSENGSPGALARAGQAFRAALARTIEELRARLESRDEGAAAREEAARSGLGAFGADRVDAGRFAQLLAPAPSLDEISAARLERAWRVLGDLHAQTGTVLQVAVPPGGSLREAVGRRLAEVGRAFGAAHAVAAARAGSEDDAEQAALLAAYPFERWNPAERDLAPPLAVDVAGADCHAAGLADLLDGRLKILLRVSGPCPAAPLARLVAPRTYVLQTDAETDLQGLVAWDGPGVAALVPEGVARFCHDPGAEPGQRLHVAHVPDGALRPVGGASAAQQAEDLALLAAWAGAQPAPASTPDVDDPAGRLAAWLLQQTDLRDV